MNDDCISREQAIKSAKCIIESNSVMKAFCILRMLNELPSVPLIGASVIEDIKAEIQKEENIWYHDCEHDFSKDFDVIRVDTVLEIIDKHFGGDADE